MANKTPLAAWLYSNRSELKPRFIELDWPRRWLPELFDFVTEIEWQGLRVEGRGVDENREIALEKSVSESIERLICARLNISSEGVAVSAALDPSTHARNELLERYYLKEHLRLRRAFIEISPEQVVFPQYSLRGNKPNVSFSRMATPSQVHGIVCSITSIEGQTKSCGFALDSDLGAAFRRSFLEAVPNFAWLSEEPLSDVVPWQIEKAFSENLESLLNSGRSELSADVIDVPRTMEDELNFRHITPLIDSPLRVARWSVIEEGQNCV